MSNHLFIIGINEYLNQKKLSSCINDCNDLKDVLLEKFDFDTSSVYEIYNENATSKKIQDALRGYIKQLNENDNLIIYYSGHGEFDEVSNTGFWVTYESNDYTDYIPNQTIVNYLNNLKCKHVFLISDSCFSNSLLLNGNFKKPTEYFEKQSRWALTSAYNEAKDSDPDSNTLFCEKILEYLYQTDKDFRVTELIEFVKSSFELNEFQTPQGAPLQITSHKGGEFIFKIQSPIDNRKFKGYNDLNKILKFYKRNTQFTETITFEDKSLKIGYILYNEVDPVLKKTAYYLYLYDGTNQIKTLKHLKENQPQIFKEKNLIIFITSEKGQKNKEIRRKNIQDKFKPISIFYIEEFIKNHCTPQFEIEEDSKYLNISNFVLPPFKHQDESNDIKEIFTNWFESTDKPIFVIKGTGGIGKTTIAQYLADSLLNENPELYVLFIDSVQIKDSLLKNKKAGRINIYNFYEALLETYDNTEEKLSEELFRLNLDAGNILIIIDGLDEVISKISNFNIEEFIYSIKNFSNELGHAKVIITCRTYFWNITELNDETFKIIELEPFNEGQARELFNISFNNDEKRTNKAISIASEFKYPSSTEEKEFIYHPYVLDIVQTIVNNEKEDVNLSESDLISNYLSKSNKTDFIIYRVCQREKIRVGQIDVDEQIKFLINFSVNYRGIIRTVDLKSIIEDSIGHSIDLNNVEAFKSHPFLKISDQSIVFRYDFLTDLFKSIYVTKYLTLKTITFDSQKDFKFIEIVNESCWYGSAFNNDILNRISQWTDDEFLQIFEIKTHTQTSVELDIIIKRKFIANLFNLCLTINHQFKSNNTEDNTYILTSLFENSTNYIDDLSIVNLNSDKNIRFNFSDKSITNGYLDNFNDFTKCIFNENTKFINCTILNIKLDTTTNNLNKNQFIDCSFDSTFDTSFQLKESNVDSYNEALKNFLNQFFKLFFSNGRLGRQWEHKVISPRFRGINKLKIDYNNFIKLLRKHEILDATSELNKTKFAITEKAKEAVIKFTKDGTVDIIILNIFNQLKK
ncbi:caspase family protein [Flavobacterium sp. MMLR14_040]|uniref:caspase family protein n=1 Tax=Flavobacterium sp. MMLR14_040 TaxID=3093843 RepID=UPI00298FA018|nr:caspase family protein [Flavobacterium sp. MMLR14_040]MDW8852110.1 caspase family protein [Flavobacterium sp. MMLR14_040]